MRACSERAGGQRAGGRAVARLEGVDGLAGEVVWWCSHAVGFDAHR